MVEADRKKKRRRGFYPRRHRFLASTVFCSLPNSSDASFRLFDCTGLGRGGSSRGSAVGIALGTHVAGALAVRSGAEFVHLLALRTGGLELLPLVGGELGSDGQQKARIRLLKLGTGLGDLVDLGQDLLFVGLIGADERFHAEFGLVDGAAHVDELLAMLQQNVIHAFALILGQVELFDHGGIVPPAAGGAQTEGSLERGPVHPEARTGALARLLRPGCESSDQGSNGEHCKYCFDSFHLLLLLGCLKLRSSKTLLFRWDRTRFCQGSLTRGKSRKSPKS